MTGTKPQLAVLVIC